jgi:hypothetical protein
MIIVTDNIFIRLGVLPPTRRRARPNEEELESGRLARCRTCENFLARCPVRHFWFVVSSDKLGYELPADFIQGRAVGGTKGVVSRGKALPHQREG